VDRKDNADARWAKRCLKLRGPATSFIVKSRSIYQSSYHRLSARLTSLPGTFSSSHVGKRQNPLRSQQMNAGDIVWGVPIGLAFAAAGSG
jgi:hypothetical protein